MFAAVLRLLVRLAMVGSVVLAFIQPASAHPHIWVNVRARMLFNTQGKLAAIEQTWTFDKEFSAWAVQGFDADGDGRFSREELVPLAHDYMQGLAQYNYYTEIKDADRQHETVVFNADPDARLSYDGQAITLDFVLYPTTILTGITDLQVEVSDPEYYVEFTFALQEAVSLKDAPSGCRVSVNPPKELPPDIAARLFAVPSTVHDIPDDLRKAVADLGNFADLICKEPIDTVAKAASPVAKVKSPPFSAPPVETGFMPGNAFFVWVYRQQIAFYKALTSEMEALKRNGSAFWILGLLSFLYGIFHAAGPGHGKLVISSYLLASETQLYRGVALSFIAAMMQSTVAVAFMVLASVVLKLTSISMSSATNAMATGSYALVAALGLWLMIRRIFGLGHHHHAAPHPSKTPLYKPHHQPKGQMALASLRTAADEQFIRALHEQDADAGFATCGIVGAATLSCGHQHDPEPDHVSASSSHAHEHGHAHAHVVTPKDLTGNWLDALPVVAAMGLRPCSGALIVLAFSLTQNLFAAGIAATYLMGLGTGITVSSLAAIAVTAKGLAQRIGGAGNPWIARATWWFELLGATAVFAFGAVLFIAAI